VSTANATINSATPALDLINAIETLMASHSNWQLVDTVVITTITHKVYKNFGTGVADNNSFGQDFYVVLSYTTATPTQIFVRAVEGWDTTTDLALRPVMDDANNATNADTSGGAVGGVALNSNVFGILTGTLLATPNTNEYYIALSKNALKFAFRRSDASNPFGCYAGIFESYVTIPNEFPLCMVINTNGLSTWTSAGALAATSRHPGRVSQVANTENFMHAVAALTATAGDTGNADLFTGKARASPALLRTRTATTVTNNPIFGNLRGRLYDTSIIPPASGYTPAIGDKLTSIDGKDHWFMNFGALLTVWVDMAAV
jgi:hypothetical protein